MKTEGKTPPWVYAAIAILSSIAFLSHLWIANYETPEAVPTGLSNSDSAIYLQAMRMLGNGFFSPYATCKAPDGPNDIAFLPMPFHWLYALVGAVARLLRIDEFIFLGLANGLFGAIYLFVAYRFLRAAAPRQANLAFLLFAMGGGLGGVVYLATAFLRLQGSGNFEVYFGPFAMYELVEGPYLSPLLHLSRLYYTVSLALGLGGLTALIVAMQRGCNRHLAFANFLLFSGAIVHIRIGGFAWAIAIIYLMSTGDAPPKARGRAAIFVTLAMAAAFAFFLAISLASPVFMRNTGVLVRESMWIVPFISVALLYLLLVPRVICSRIRHLPRPIFLASWGAVGYLALFVLLFAGYQIYFGNFLFTGESAATSAMSDWALLGAIAGVVYGTRQKLRPALPDDSAGWVVPWFLLFTAIALSGWGRGWFLELTPQRLMLFLGLPLSILSATAIQAWGRRRPRRAHAYVAVMLVCGIASVVVGTLFFQGPLGRVPGQGPFAHLHPEIMTPGDAALLDRLEPGTVLAPGSFSDVIALREGMSVLGGIGGTDLSDRMSTELDPRIARFFSTEPIESREAFVREWCIDYVYCPDTWPVDAGVVDALRSSPWLRTVAQESHGILFRVEAKP